MKTIKGKARQIGAATALLSIAGLPGLLRGQPTSQPEVVALQPAQGPNSMTLSSSGSDRHGRTIDAAKNPDGTITIVELQIDRSSFPGRWVQSPLARINTPAPGTYSELYLPTLNEFVAIPGPQIPKANQASGQSYQVASQDQAPVNGMQEGDQAETTLILCAAAVVGILGMILYSKIDNRQRIYRTGSRNIQRGDSEYNHGWGDKPGDGD
jgi:hypothetical protein